MTVAPTLLTDEPGDGFAVSDHQLAAVIDPRCTLRRLAAKAVAPRVQRHLGRPWFIWRDNLELARNLNDRLAAGAPD